MYDHGHDGDDNDDDATADERAGRSDTREYKNEQPGKPGTTLIEGRKASKEDR